MEPALSTRNARDTNLRPNRLARDLRAVRPSHATLVVGRKPRAFDCGCQELEPSVTSVRHPRGPDGATPANGLLRQNLAGRRWKWSADDVARAIKCRATTPEAALPSSTGLSYRHDRLRLSPYANMCVCRSAVTPSSTLDEGTPASAGDPVVANRG